MPVGVLDDARVLVGRLGLVHDAALVGRLDDADGDEEERGDRHGREQPAPAEAERGDDREHDRVREERALRADERDQQQRRAERADQRADRRDRVHPSGRLAGVLDALELEPDRPRRDRAEHQHRHRDEREHAEQRAGEAADRDVVERVDREREQRLRDDRDDRRAASTRRARAGRAPAGADGGRRAGRRTSSRSTARRARPRSCSPTRSWSRRRTARSAARRRSRSRASRSRRRRRAARAAAGGGSPCGVQYGAALVPTGCGSSVPAMDTAALAHLDRTHLWHPFTQQRGWEEEAPVMIERGAGLAAVRHRRQRLHRRRVVAVVHRPRPRPSRDRRRGARAARPRGALDDARPLAPRRGAAGRAPGGDRAGGPGARVLLRQRLHGRRGGREDGLPVLAAARPDAADRVHLPARRLPRRHDRLGLGRRDRPLPRDLPQAAVRDPPRRARGRRRHAAAAGGARRARGRRDRRAARAGSGGHDRAPRGLPAQRCATSATSTACC